MLFSNRLGVLSNSDLPGDNVAAASTSTQKENILPGSRNIKSGLKWKLIPIFLQDVRLHE